MMKRYDPRGAEFLRMGRYNPDEDGCRLWWSGSGVRTRFEGVRLELEATAADGEHTPWLAVTVDCAPVARFPLRPGTHRYDLLGRLEGGATHEVALLRDTQPTDGDGAPLVFEAVYADGTLCAPESRPRLVEFLGDSLTVGEGTVGAKDCMEWRMIWISNQFAFPTLVAEAMNAEKRVVALGGWGAHLSYDANPEHTIGTIYEDLCGVCPAGAAPYDFAAQRRADAVVINLGTNDGSGIASLPEGERAAAREALEDSAARLMELVRGHNPGAAILWAYGLCGDAVAEPLRRAVERRRAAGDVNAHYRALDDAADVGSRMHPSRGSHVRAAEQIAQKLKELGL